MSLKKIRDKKDDILACLLFLRSTRKLVEILKFGLMPTSTNVGFVFCRCFRRHVCCVPS